MGEQPAGAAAYAVARAWQTLARHQVASAVATALDFGSMVVLVQRLRLTPTAATGISAPLGALANFWLGRAWVFPKSTGPLRGQAIRYVLVSAASAAWNTLGEHLVHGRLHAQYVLARALVAVAVSVLWNFPMQRHFVFPEGKVR
ncbi:MAG: GtrA family protein [Polyangiaceae bacterium]|jgi:putative flippase GtrA